MMLSFGENGYFKKTGRNGSGKRDFPLEEVILASSLLIAPSSLICGTRCVHLLGLLEQDHGLGGSPRSSGGWKPEIKARVGLGSPEASLPGLQGATFSQPHPVCRHVRTPVMLE